MFFSKKLNKAQRNYSTYRELLAVYEAIKYTRDFTQGRQLTVRTDHKSLSFAFQQRLDKASPRQIRQLDFISQVTTDIIYLRGQENIAADALSRISAIECPIIITTEELTEKQQQDKELQEILKGKTSLKLRQFTLIGSQLPLYCECSEEAIKPYNSETLRKKIFDAIHGLARVEDQLGSKSVKNSFGPA